MSQREIGSRTKSFASALRAALGEDPDVILVGETRDLETISLALTAAETGHLVFATLHTKSAPKTIEGKGAEERRQLGRSRCARWSPSGWCRGVRGRAGPPPWRSCSSRRASRR